jgi:anti-anti-sigma regulatory factor
LNDVPTDRIVIHCDASEIASADEATLDALLRLQLLARRVGVSITLLNARPELVDLLTLAGLAEELGIETRRESEECEQVGIDEEVDPGDATV